MTKVTITRDAIIPPVFDPVDVTEIVAEDGAEKAMNDWLAQNDSSVFQNVESITIKGRFPGTHSKHYSAFPTADWYFAVEPNKDFWDSFDANHLLARIYDYSFKKYKVNA